MKQVLTNTFPIKKMIHGFLTVVFLLPTGTVQSGTRTDTNKVAIDKTKPLGNFEEAKKPDSCEFENDTPVLRQGKGPEDKNGNWLMPQVVVLIIIGKKRQLIGVFEGVGKLMKSMGKLVKKWFKGTR